MVIHLIHLVMNWWGRTNTNDDDVTRVYDVLTQPSVRHKSGKDVHWFSFGHQFIFQNLGGLSIAILFEWLTCDYRNVITDVINNTNVQRYCKRRVCNANKLNWKHCDPEAKWRIMAPAQWVQHQTWRALSLPCRHPLDPRSQCISAQSDKY